MVHNVEFSCSHISFVWLHGLNSLQWWLLTCPDLTNVVWFKNNIDRHEYPKQLQAHPAKKSEIPDTRNTRWFWKKIGYGLGIAKNYRVGSGIGYPSGTAPKTTPDAPLYSQRWIRHKRTPTDTLRQSWGMSEGCLGVFEDAWQVQSMRNLVWLEPTHHFGTTLKWGIFFTWRLRDIKISKPPYVPVPKMVQLCHFL